jgi:NAD(P)-dependent dehydrogenase (short-subunit alcohol dehydrogenase family)
MSFSGGTALVTGGASGIGRALGAALEEAGAKVVLADVATGQGSACRHLDVRDAGAFDALVEEVGPVSLLINCAGISLGGATHEMSVSHWDRIIDVNIRGVVNGIRAVYPSMIERGSGQIVNVASGAGLAALPFVAAYAMTKHAVVGLSTALRPEAALHGVRVSVLCPGAVDTPILDRLPDADLPPTASPPVSARRYLAAVRQKPVDVDRFARLALKGIEHNRGIIVVPTSARSLWYLHRLSPALTGSIANLLARRVDKTLMSESGGPGSDPARTGSRGRPDR